MSRLSASSAYELAEVTGPEGAALAYGVSHPRRTLGAMMLGWTITLVIIALLISWVGFKKTGRVFKWIAFFLGAGAVFMLVTSK